MKKYFPVIYLKNGDACIGSPCDTEDECRKELARAVVVHFDKVKATTYLYRESASVQEIFGTPRSRDLMQDKKFLKELRK